MAGDSDKQEVDKPKRRAYPALTVNRMFAMIFLANCVVCAATFIGMFASAAFADQTTRDGIRSSCDAVFKMLAGAFIGLLGGRAAAPDKVQVR